MKIYENGENIPFILFVLSTVSLFKAKRIPSQSYPFNHENYQQNIRNIENTENI